MITLRDQARMDTAIGAITMDECQLMSKVLHLVGDSWYIRWLLPKEIKDNILSVQMLAATLSRTPAERIPMNEDIKLAMIRDGI